MQSITRTFNPLRTTRSQFRVCPFVLVKGQNTLIQCVWQRHFVSATLLSRTDFEKKTVAELKDELRNRGDRDSQADIACPSVELSRAGKSKSVLISRLCADDVKQSNAPLPGQASTFSTSTVTPATTKEPVVHDLGSRGPNLTPALLNEGFKSSVWPASVSLPATATEPEYEAIVPYIPDKFDSHMSPNETPSDGFQPQVSTASHPQTLPGGGPALAVDLNADDAPSLSQEATDAIREAKSFDSSVLKDLFVTFGLESSTLSDGETSTVEKVKQAKERVYDALEKKTGVRVPPLKEVINSGQAKSGGRQRWKLEDRPLDGAERAGAWTLGGILVGAWILAGIAAPTKPASSTTQHDNTA